VGQQGDLPELERIDEGAEIVGKQVDRVRAWRDLALARSAQVVGDHAGLRRQVGDLTPPEMGAGAAEAVHQHDRRTGAELLDVRAVAVQLEVQCCTSAAVGMVGTAAFAFWMCSMSIR
jgi:hypothetical protein